MAELEFVRRTGGELRVIDAPSESYFLTVVVAPESADAEAAVHLTRSVVEQLVDHLMDRLNEDV